jgi:hypothetical protein
VHDVVLPELGKVAPYGVYDIAANTGWVNLGITSNTAAFRGGKHLALVARTGPGALSRHHPADPDHGGLRWQQWCPRAPMETELQRLADGAGLSIAVAHLPPGTNNWNRVEHRLFAFITQNWRGKPLV